jgi:hypothetical protein
LDRTQVAVRDNHGTWLASHELLKWAEIVRQSSVAVYLRQVMNFRTSAHQGVYRNVVANSDRMEKIFRSVEHNMASSASKQM